MNTSEEECLLPKATIARVVKSHTPGYVRSSAEFRDLLGQCASEFVQLICSEANEVCMKNKKSKISEKHLVEALESLGFEKYIESVQGIGQEATDGRKRRRIAKNAKKSNKTPEQLQEEQEALFARARSLTGSTKSSIAVSEEVKEIPE